MATSAQSTLSPARLTIEYPDRADIEETGVTPVRTVQDLGPALRQARKALHLTQSELALAAGVGVRFLVELEAGKPTVRLLPHFAEAIGAAHLAEQ